MRLNGAYPALLAGDLWDRSAMKGSTLAWALSLVVVAACGTSAVDDPTDGGVTADGETVSETSADSGSTYSPPSARGPYVVGTVRHAWVDADRKRKVPVRLWYPATAEGDGDAEYLFILKGDAHEGAQVDDAGGPYPLVLFSHGFKGAAEQSYSLCEHVASWGFVVAAPDHVTNTLLDFDATDEDVAAVSAERPRDIAYTAARVTDEAFALSAAIDDTKVAVMGHSFGGWTALMVAGASVDIAHSNAECKAGAKSDIMCKYTALMADGVIDFKPPIAGLKAAIYLAPGGFSSFGAGLDGVAVPGLIIGGSKDTTTTLAVEIDPIYAALPAPKAKLVIEGAGHMSFTDVCSLSFAKTVAGLKEMCAAPGLLAPDRATLVTRTHIVAFLDRFVRGNVAAGAMFDGSASGKHFEEAHVQSVGVGAP